MELLLNLLWLALVVPAYWLWRQQKLRPRGPANLSLLTSALLLASLLILLFPVISVSDDLHPLRQAMEESSTKRIVRQAAAMQVSLPLAGHGSSPALFVRGFRNSVPLDEYGESVPAIPERLPAWERCGPRNPRAPPFSSIG